jgi:NADPH2 dehydrogenase
MAVSKSRLSRPSQVGNINLKHRIVKAAMSRFRADDTHVPLPITVNYQAQRACVPETLLITVGTFISKHAGGYPNVPGIWSDEQIAA